MPARARKPKRPRDVNQLAAKIVRLSTGQECEPSLPAAKGGRVRTAALTDKERRAIAEKAARDRGNKG